MTPGQQELVDAHKRYRELRRQHLRRTRVIGGRLWLGRDAGLVVSVALYGTVVGGALGAFGIGIDLDAAALRGAGLLLAVSFFIAVVGTYQARRDKKGRPVPTPVREILGGLAIGFIGVGAIVSPDMAQILGFMIACVSAVTLVRGSLRLIGAGLRRLFGKRPGPDELEAISERPAA